MGPEVIGLLLQTLEQDDVVGGGGASDGQAFAVTRPGKIDDRAVREVCQLMRLGCIQRLYPDIRWCAGRHVREALTVWCPPQRVWLAERRQRSSILACRKVAYCGYGPVLFVSRPEREGAAIR